MSKIGIFYGPELGSVAKVAGLISDIFGKDNTDLVLIKNTTVQQVLNYDNIIFGFSTIGKEVWNASRHDSDWDDFVPHLNKVDLLGKTIAMYCLGDHLQYPNNFVDALGWMNERLLKINATVIGRVSVDGYRFNESEGAKNALFYGLAIDEDNESDKTPARVKSWVEQLKKQGF